MPKFDSLAAGSRGWRESQSRATAKQIHLGTRCACRLAAGAFFNRFQHFSVGPNAPFEPALLSWLASPRVFLVYPQERDRPWSLTLESSERQDEDQPIGLRQPRP